MERSEILNELLKLYAGPSYLEIGVDAGQTFFAVQATTKVAVDPFFKFPVPPSKDWPPGVTFHGMTSDDYFGRLSESDKFNVIFIDGLHTFEQTLRDFVNATNFSSANGVIVIDDVRPSSYFASIPDLNLSVQLRAQTGNTSDQDWMGDVYKLIYHIDTFYQQYSYATVLESHGQSQTIVWKEPRTNVTERTAYSISTTDYSDSVLNCPYKVTPFSEIISILRAR